MTASRSTATHGNPPAPPLLVLASRSPRRSELLRRIVADFEVDPADADESRLGAEGPADYVARVAKEKAEAVARRWAGAFVLGADTTIALDGDLIGKPADGEAARAILERLSGRTHEVFTGVALVVPQSPGGTPEPPVVRVESTEVTFGELTAAEIDAYVASGEPLGKAGAYAAQGLGAVLIERILGDPTTVIGLPLRLTRQLLNEARYPQP